MVTFGASRGRSGGRSVCVWMDKNTLFKMRGFIGSRGMLGMHGGGGAGRQSAAVHTYEDTADASVSM